VSETAAINWVKRAEQTGSRTPAKLGEYKPMMLAPQRAFVEAACREPPDTTLQSLTEQMRDDLILVRIHPHSGIW
jgi:transposase